MPLRVRVLGMAFYALVCFSLVCGLQQWGYSWLLYGPLVVVVFLMGAWHLRRQPAITLLYNGHEHYYVLFQGQLIPVHLVKGWFSPVALSVRVQPIDATQTVPVLVFWRSAYSSLVWRQLLIYVFRYQAQHVLIPSVGTQ